MKITPIIGLEVHVELKTKSKMFCGCDASHFQAEPNTHTCPVCLGLPGALPVPNKLAIEWCMKLGLALGCSINLHSFFERKNYFYPDLPKGYQISQYQKPFCVNGNIEIDGKKIRINRVHQEEDTGKSQHMVINGEELSLLDFNRCGVPLVEIVSEPDIESGEMAKKYLNKIQQVVRYLEISDADIEKGSMRCEPTINLKIEKNGKEYFTPLAEIKNVASLTGVMNAIGYEIERQTKEFEETGESKSPTNKTTRGWDAEKGQTFLQREKEGSADYRYFPEPDIPPFEFSEEEVERIRQEIPEMPEIKIRKYLTWGLTACDAEILANDRVFSLKYERAVGHKPSKEEAKFTANLFLGPLKEVVEKATLDQITPEFFIQIFTLVSDGTVSGTAARTLASKAFLEKRDFFKVAKEDGLIQISDSGKIEEIVKKILAENPKAVEDYKKNPNSIGFLVGQVMKASSGSANPKMAREVLERLLVV